MAWIASGFALLAAFFIGGIEWREHPDIDALFAGTGASATFVLYDPTRKELVGYNQERARQRFVPASTFKIANTLIGLDSSAVTSVDDVLPYGGEPQAFPAWEHDMPLREALPLSAVPIYQELARRIGLKEMNRGVRRLDYGNVDIGLEVDRFWLDGPLRISAVEQARFLARLAQLKLPIAERHQRTLHELTLIDSGEGWTLHGKTGWENAPGKGVGWWVGWITRGDRVYAFALNMDMQTPEDADRRVMMGRQALRALGYL